MSHTNVDVPPETLDRITELLVRAPGPAARAAAIHRLVAEMYETVWWLHPSDAADAELRSVSQLLTEAVRHQRRVVAANRSDAASPGAADGVDDAPWLGAHWADLVSLAATPTTVDPDSAGQEPAPADDDVTVPVGYFTDHFWSLVALLGDGSAGIEALAQELATSEKTDIHSFQTQVRNAAALLDTPAHRRQQVRNLDDPRETVATAMSDDVFSEARMAVVASGREVWLGVLADPVSLGGGWSFQRGQGLLAAPTAALDRAAATAGRGGPQHQAPRAVDSGYRPTPSDAV